MDNGTQRAGSRRRTPTAWWWTVVLALAAVLPVAPLLAQPPAMDRADWDQAIADLRASLLAGRGADGLWPDGSAGPSPASLRGSQTAIVVFALLESGVDPADPQVRSALSALADVRMDAVFNTAWRVLAVSSALATPATQPADDPGPNGSLAALLDADVRRLVAARRPGGRWPYVDQPDAPDGGNFLAALVTLALARADSVVPQAKRWSADDWAGLARFWAGQQLPDGGFGHGLTAPQGRPPASTPLMSALGARALQVTQAALTRHGRRDPAVDAAMARALLHLQGQVEPAGQRVGELDQLQGWMLAGVLLEAAGPASAPAETDRWFELLAGPLRGQTAIGPSARYGAASNTAFAVLMLSEVRRHRAGPWRNR